MKTWVAGTGDSEYAGLSVISEFIAEAAMMSTPDSEPRVQGVRAPAGIGKTRAVLTAIANHGPALLRKGHIVLHFPTMKLADEAHERFRALAMDSGDELPSRVLRGRSAQLHPEGGPPLCRKSRLVETAARLTRIMPSFCESESKLDGSKLTCEHAKSCAYLTQFRDLQHSVIFATHGHLDGRLPEIEGKISLRIIDESFWQGLCRVSRLNVMDWLMAPRPLANRTNLQKLDVARTIVFAELRDERPVLVALRANGFSEADLRDFARFERETMRPLEISPDMDERQQEGCLRAFDDQAWHNARRRAGIWELLADNYQRDNTERLCLSRNTNHVSTDKFASRMAADPAAGSSSPENKFSLVRHSFHPLTPREPTLVIDADADEDILKKCISGIELEKIVAWPTAEVIQLENRTLSQKFLLDPEEGKSRRATVLGVIEEEVRRAKPGKVLMVSTKKILAALHDDECTPGHGEAQLKRPLRGADVRWFGNNLRGLDEFRDHRAIVVVGRLQQRPETIDEKLRCLAADQTAPLKFAAPMIGQHPGEIGNCPTHREFRQIFGSDGRPLTSVRTNVHPDPWGRIVEAQLRESATSQTIARLRLIHPGAEGEPRKRVIVLSSMPVPGLLVDQTVRWSELHEPRLRSALIETGWTGLRLSAKGLAEDAPKTFCTEIAAKSWITRHGGATRVRSAVKTTVSGRPHLFVRVRIKGEPGRPSLAILFCRPEEAEARATELWPRVHSIDIVNEKPAPNPITENSGANGKAALQMPSTGKTSLT